MMLNTGGRRSGGGSNFGSRDYRKQNNDGGGGRGGRGEGEVGGHDSFEFNCVENSANGEGVCSVDCFLNQIKKNCSTT